MNKLLESLSGKKTYITAVLAAIFNLGLAFGWWTADNQVIIAINGLLAAFGFGFLRAGVTKSGQPSK
jgi:hypothetical protein